MSTGKAPGKLELHQSHTSSYTWVSNWGSCYSFQDTVVALQALAQYAYLTFSKKTLNTVEVHFMETPSKIFQVNDKNRFLLQQASLPTIPGRYNVEVNGSGCVYLQVSKLGTQHHPLGTEQRVLHALFLSICHALL